MQIEQALQSNSPSDCCCHHGQQYFSTNQQKTHNFQEIISTKLAAKKTSKTGFSGTYRNHPKHNHASHLKSNSRPSIHSSGNPLPSVAKLSAPDQDVKLTKFVNKVSHITENLFNINFNFRQKPSSPSEVNNTWNGIFGFEANKLDKLLEQFRDVMAQAQCLGCRDTPNSILTLSIVKISYGEERYQSSIQSMEQREGKNFEDIVSSLINSFHKMAYQKKLSHG
jgi:hypothetical protein